MLTFQLHELLWPQTTKHRPSLGILFPPRGPPAYLFTELLGGPPRRQPVGGTSSRGQGLQLPRVLPRLRPLAALPQEGRRRRRRGRQRRGWRVPAVTSRLGPRALPGPRFTVAVEDCGRETQGVSCRRRGPKLSQLTSVLKSDAFESHFHLGFISALLLATPIYRKYHVILEYLVKIIFAFHRICFKELLYSIYVG